MKKRWKFALMIRRVIVILLLLVELVLLGVILFGQRRVSQIAQIISLVLSLTLTLRIAATHNKGGYKLMWIFLILAFPFFGCAMYLMYQMQFFTRRFGKKLSRIEKKTNEAMFYPETAYDTVKSEMPDVATQVAYLQDYVGFPVYGNNVTEYFSPGEEFFKSFLTELEKAEKYIFLEYFIVQEGKMWDSVLDILKRKAAVGVIVRVLYDDMGCFLTLPNDYPRTLKKYGIECYKFNPFRPVLSSVQNNRDHRKIASIDGRVAFTGGINLADEYINAFEKHGHWKDSALMIKGNAAWSLTVMFLQMWELVSNKPQDLHSFYPNETGNTEEGTEGFVQPYADSPMSKENVGEHVYLQIINRAKNYIYINTPYLIIDETMISALRLAAKSGVDVRIVTPHRWDKWFVHMTTRSYYRELLQAGVKIYEYTNGFMHSKTFVADDSVATVGTVNLDYRSLYLHFECGALMYRTRAVDQVKNDFLETLETCQEVTLKDCKTGRLKRVFQDLLRFFAPLM